MGQSARSFARATLLWFRFSYDLVVACGVEKMTDTVNAETTTGLVMAADADYESIHGVTFVGINALLMRRYMHEYNVTCRLCQLCHRRPSKRDDQSQRHVLQPDHGRAV